MIHIFSNLTEEYDAVLDGTESRLMLNKNNPNKLIIEDIQDKLRGILIKTAREMQIIGMVPSSKKR